MLRRTCVFASVLIAALGSGCGDDLDDPNKVPEQQQRFGATLDGASVVPSVASNAAGSAFLQFENASSQSGEGLFYGFQISGVRAATWVLLRRGQVGQNGDVLWVFCGLLEFRACPAGERIEMAGLIEASDFRGRGVDMNGLRRAIEAGETYLQVDSKRFPGGELRGQLQEMTLGSVRE